MPVFRLRGPLFPDPAQAEPDGLLAVGGDLRPARLLEAYSRGIFPWSGPEDPLLWWCPPVRALWLPGDFRPGANLRRDLRRARCEVRVDTAFPEVVEGCAGARRDADGTWIGPDYLEAYGELHRLGFAHSFEAWREGELVGGLYGLSLGAAFFGESMFSRVTGASKVAFAALCERVFAEGFHFVDGQLENPHLMRLGARTEPREAFLDRLGRALREPTRRGRWQASGTLLMGP